jgi:hypothetical protein
MADTLTLDTAADTRINSPNGVRAGRPRPADSTGHSRHIEAPRNMRMHSHTATAGRSDRSRDPGLAAAVL